MTEVAGTLFPMFGCGDTPARIVVILLAIGFPLFLVFSWVFEITPGGLMLERDVIREESIAPQTGKRIDRLIIVLLVAAVGYFAFDKFILDPVRDVEIAETAHQEGRSEALVGSFGDKSIAVLPFADMSRNGDQEYMSDGIAQELTNLLARIPEVRVASRSSAFSFKGAKKPIAEVANALKVSYVLEGWVRLDGSVLRIDALLADARSDTVVWRETYDRTLDDIFAIQEDIAADIVDALEIEILGEFPSIQQIHPEAYRLWLLANHLSAPGSHTEHAMATAAMQAALVIHPNYAEGWRKLAVTYLIRERSGQLPRDEAVPAAIEALERSIQIDPDQARTHTTIGVVAAFYEQNLPEAAEHYSRAIEIDPADLLILNNVHEFLQILGRFDDAIAVSNYVTSQQFDMFALEHVMDTALLAGKQDQSIASGNRVLSRQPEAVRIRYIIGRAYLQKGDVETALEYFENERFELFRLLGHVMAHHASGQPDLSDAALETLIDGYGKVEPFRIAGVLAYRDEADRAFEWIENAIEIRDDQLAYAIVEPIFANIHPDPRWPAFLESRNMSPAQVDAIEFEISLPEER